MEGEELGGPRMYLYSYHCILSINTKKLLSSGFQTAPLDMTQLPMDKVINFGEENLPCGIGFYIDGSKLYMVGGEWVEKYLAYDEWKLDISKGDIGISSSIYMADLSYSTVKFSHVHEFEASKPLLLVMKIKERIYTPSTSCVSPSFEVYDSSHSFESITRLRTPPFHEHFKCSFTYVWGIRLR